MKYAGRNPYGQLIVGTLFREYSDGVTIEYENGVREFIIKARVEGPIKDEEEETVSHDLFGPIR